MRVSIGEGFVVSQIRTGGEKRGGIAMIKESSLSFASGMC